MDFRTEQLCGVCHLRINPWEVQNFEVVFYAETAYHKKCAQQLELRSLKSETDDGKKNSRLH